VSEAVRDSGRSSHILTEVLHFSEDPSIERFMPHVPSTNPTQQPMVWAIDAEHAPLYWFPRDCPRVACWYGPDTDRDRAQAAIGVTDARRVHAVEARWMQRIGDADLFVYRLPAAGFRPWSDADGHWVATEPVEPLEVEPVGDLLQRHVAAGIEIRILPSLWALHDAVVASTLRFSMVRMQNAQARA
jgi:hypothetical protein